MTQQDAWMIVVLLAILALGPLYGYWIGKIGMRGSWNVRKIKKVAAGPLLAAGAIALSADLIFRIFYEGPGPEPIWARFPWVIFVAAGFFALFAAAKGAGVPWDEFRNRGGKISDRKNNDLSIT